MHTLTRWGDLTERFERRGARRVNAEHVFLKRSRRARFLYDLTTVLPFIPATYSALRARVVLCCAQQESRSRR